LLDTEPEEEGTEDDDDDVEDEEGTLEEELDEGGDGCLVSFESDSGLIPDTFVGLLL